MCSTWNKNNQSKSEDVSNQGREFFSFFLTISNEVTELNSKLDDFIDDITSYDELSHALDELHEDVASFCLKNNALKVKSSSL